MKLVLPVADAKREKQQRKKQGKAVQVADQNRNRTQVWAAAMNSKEMPDKQQKEAELEVIVEEQEEEKVAANSKRRCNTHDAVKPGRGKS